MELRNGFLWEKHRASATHTETSQGIRPVKKAFASPIATLHLSMT